MLSLSALRYAASAARLKSFSAAARECGVSQPTVSAAVAELESTLGTPLFLRGGRHLDLSSSGTRLLPKISEVLSAVESLQAETDTLVPAARTELRIGFTPLAGAGRVALLLEPFRRQQPETRLLFFESSLPDLEKRLDAGQLDLIIGCGFRQVRSRRRLRLFQDALVLCSTAHAGSAGTAVSLRSASQSRLLFTQDLCGLATATGSLFEAARLRVDVYPGRAMSYGALEDWVELGLGNAVVPLHHVRNRDLARPLSSSDGKPLSLTMEAVWKPTLVAAAHATRFLNYLRRVVPPLAKGMER